MSDINQFTRPVKTDNLVFVDEFNGTSLDATKWTSTIGTGGSVSVASGSLVIGSGTTANAVTEVRSTFTVSSPCRLQVHYLMSQRIVNQDLWIGLVNAGNTEGIHWLMNATSPTTGYAKGMTASSTSTSSGLTINTSTSENCIEIELTPEVAVFRDGLPHTTTSFATRGIRTRDFPAYGTQLQVVFRWVNGASAPASNTNVTISRVFVEDMTNNMVTVRSGVGGVDAASSIPVYIAGGSSTADTELPAAAALADATANPTSPLAGAANELFNGSTWDRFRNNINTTTSDTGAKTATFNGATVTNYNATGAIITAVVSSVSGTTPTMTCQLQVSYDGTNFLNYGPASSALTAAGSVMFVVYPCNISQAAGVTPANLVTGATQTVAINAPLPRTWRVAYTIGGTTPSFTLTGTYVNYIL